MLLQLIELLAAQFVPLHLGGLAKTETCMAMVAF